MNPREQLVWAAKELFNKGLIGLYDGNISIRAGENSFLISPMGIPKNILEPYMIVEVFFDGSWRCVGGCRPPLEYLLHLNIYKNNISVDVIVHSTSPYTIALVKALKERIIDLIHREIPLVKEYAKGGIKFIKEVKPDDPNHINIITDNINGVDQILILGEYGVIAVSDDIFRAVNLVELLEKGAKIVTLSKLISLIPQQLQSSL
ncbi:MAG TPA: class II aldolase/adducin family protein [Desulfurococcales archaeon]|nr:class II aldolase/adducin family protein [Desulfurococcales archaeon]